MLTVLVKKEDDVEVIYECASVEKEPYALLMRGDNLGSGDCKGLEILGPGGNTMSWDWDRKMEDVKQLDERKQVMVYVMNSHGQTVARYSLPNMQTKIQQSSNRIRIVPIKNHDTKNVIHSLDLEDENETYFRIGETIDLFDVSKDFSGLLGYPRRDSVVADKSEISAILVHVNMSGLGAAIFRVNTPGLCFRTPSGSECLGIDLLDKEVVFILNKAAVYSGDSSAAREIQKDIGGQSLSIKLSGTLDKNTGELKVRCIDGTVVAGYSILTEAYCFVGYFT